jgi:hypothetical protein
VFFPAEFQRRLAKERLGVEADEIDGGHPVALSRPELLADRLVRYLRSPAMTAYVAAEAHPPMPSSRRELLPMLDTLAALATRQ